MIITIVMSAIVVVIVETLRFNTVESNDRKIITIVFIEHSCTDMIVTDCSILLW